MNVEIIASTAEGNISTCKQLDGFGGKIAAVCYSTKNIRDILNEEEGKSLVRAADVMQKGHHSIFDHEFITLGIEAEKLFFLLLNDQKFYNTSERSYRYTKPKLEGEEAALYNKWNQIVLDRINEFYPPELPGNRYLDDAKRRSLAHENARFTASVMTQTSGIYTTSVRQLSYYYKWMQDILSKDNQHVFLEMLKPTMSEFCKKLESYDILDSRLMDDQRGRTFNFIRSGPKFPEYFGGSYCTYYYASIPHLGDTMRHRTIDYSFALPEEYRFYVPEIIKGDQELVEEWNEDMWKIKDKYPQGMQVEVQERGTFEAFLLKMKLRCCTRAQIEVRNQTRKTWEKYVQSPALDDEAKEILNRYKGPACTHPDRECNERCGFAPAMDGSSLI